MASSHFGGRRGAVLLAAVLALASGVIAPQAHGSVGVRVSELGYAYGDVVLDDGRVARISVASGYPAPDRVQLHGPDGEAICAAHLTGSYIYTVTEARFEGEMVPDSEDPSACAADDVKLTWVATGPRQAVQYHDRVTPSLCADNHMIGVNHDESGVLFRAPAEVTGLVGASAVDRTNSAWLSDRAGVRAHSRCSR